MQLYFLISSFKYVNNVKTSVFDYYLYDPTTYLHYQIQVYSGMREYLHQGTIIIWKAQGVPQ